ncbi:MAG: PEP-CTERM sorting domain-containing protein [Phycisphaerales bacterium]|nr:PEP-CTERM sorting domain-containing protein [Phycisphaerales bacterium]
MNTRWCMVALMIAALGGTVASARPSNGRNCSTCHTGGSLGLDIPEVVGFDGYADPDETLTGATNRGLLKVFTVMPGQSIDLSARVDLGTFLNNAFAIELKRMETIGVEHGGSLGFTADADWNLQIGVENVDPTRPYYTLPDVDGIFFTAPTTFTFSMLVDPATPPDYYDLEFAVAGQPGEFYGDEHFYLRVIPEPATIALLATGLVAIGVRSRTGSRNARAGQ